MPRSRRAFGWWAVAVVSAALLAGAPGSPAVPAIEYDLDFSGAEHRILAVSATFRAVEGPLVIRMSRTSPGRYAVHDFGKNVHVLGVEDEHGAPLALTTATPHEWSVRAHAGTVRFRYRVFGDRVDGTYLAVDLTHGHVNIPAALVWARGLEERPARVRIRPPAGAQWNVATQLFPTSDPLEFTAPNLSYLIDSPIEASAFTRRSFDAPPLSGNSTTRPTIVLALHHTGGEQDADAFARDLSLIVAETGAVFGEYPRFDSGTYTFLADYLPWASGDGMEHRNSTVITSSATIAGSKQLLAETAAHEFFHAWNVERIRPRSLEPFDLEQPTASPDLWLAEGVTSYYASLVMTRAGLMTSAQFAQSVQQDLDVVLSSPAHRIRSAEDMSRMASLVDGAQPRDRTDWNHSYISYYTHGSVLGLGLDLAIRQKTSGRKSLDDLMRAMWRHHGAPGGARVGVVDRPYTAADVSTRLGEVVSDAAFASDWVGRFVQGRQVPEFGPLLAQAGFVLRPRLPGRASLGRVALERRGDRLRIGAAPPPGSAAWQAGLAEDDEIVAVGGREVKGVADLDAALARARPGETLSIRFVRRGARAVQERTVTLEPDSAVLVLPIESAGGSLTSDHRRFRESWLGSRRQR